MTGTAIITGGAGGIAGELAALLLKRGFQLLLLDRDEHRLSERAQSLGGAVRCVTADLTDPHDLERAATLIAGTPDLELLVNNAGIIEPGDVADLPYATLERHVAINLLAPMRLTQAAIGPMISRRSGCILSIVSAAGVVSLPGSAAYSASKFGLRGFLTALSQEVVRHGVKVRSVFPGPSTRRCCVMRPRTAVRRSIFSIKRCCPPRRSRQRACVPWTGDRLKPICRLPTA